MSNRTGTKSESGCILTFATIPKVAPPQAQPGPDLETVARWLGINHPKGVNMTDYSLQVGSNFGVAFSVFGNLAGVAVDDDGSVYFQQVGLIQFTGANIVKLTSRDVPGQPALAVAGSLHLQP